MFAVEGLSDSLRTEFKQFGIDVVVIEPGAILTKWNAIARENLLNVSGGTDYSELHHFRPVVVKDSVLLGKREAKSHQQRTKLPICFRANFLQTGDYGLK